jgi:hypothetical protein
LRAARRWRDFKEGTSVTDDRVPANGSGASVSPMLNLLVADGEALHIQIPTSREFNS